MAPLVKIYPRLFPWNSGPLRTPGPGTLGQKRRRSVDRRASERASKRASDRLVGQVRGGKGRTLSQKDAKQRASERASECVPTVAVAGSCTPESIGCTKTDPKPFLIHDPLSASSRDPELQCVLPVRASPWVDHLGSARIFLQSSTLSRWMISFYGGPARTAAFKRMDGQREGVETR